MANVIDIAELREAKADGDATARLHEALCLAADATAARALCDWERSQIVAGVVRALGPGWGLKLKIGS